MPEQPTDASLQKIRALCRELAARHHLDDAARDELCAHMEDKLAGYLSGEVRISEDDALHLVRLHFGDAARVARNVSREDRLANADRFFSAAVNHTRLYTALLLILGLSTLLSMPLGLYIWSLRQTDGAAIHAKIPNWALPWQAAICGSYLLLIVATLWLRRRRPATGRQWTRVLNYLLLAAVPLGTLLGIYGLLKVDRERQPAVQ